MTTTLLVDGDMSVTLGRNDIWSFKANPYESASNYERLRSIGIEVSTFERFGKKMGGCTNHMHVRYTMVMVAMLFVAPIITLVMGLLKGIPLEVIFYIAIGMDVLCVILGIFYYFRYQPILYRRAKYLCEVESLKSATTGIEYKLSGCGFRLTVTKKAGVNPIQEKGKKSKKKKGVKNSNVQGATPSLLPENSAPLLHNDSNILEEIYNVPFFFVKDKDTDKVVVDEMAQISKAIGRAEVREIYKMVAEKHIELDSKHMSSCLSIVMIIITPLLALFVILGFVFGIIYEILALTISAAAASVAMVLLLAISCSIINGKFRAEFREYIDRKNRTDFRHSGFYVDPSRIHYLFGLFAFNRTFHPMGDNYENDPQTNKYLK